VWPSIANRAFENGDLVPQRQILQSKFALGDQERPSGQQQAPRQVEHGVGRSLHRGEFFKDSALDEFLVRTANRRSERRYTGATLDLAAMLAHTW
jgi:hypothetical protein